MEHTKSLKRHLNIFQLAQEHKKNFGSSATKVSFIRLFRSVKFNELIAIYRGKLNSLLRYGHLTLNLWMFTRSYFIGMVTSHVKKDHNLLNHHCIFLDTISKEMMETFGVLKRQLQLNILH